mgnify:CR=1 FL=1
MRLAVSQISWNTNEDACGLDLLLRKGILDWEAVPFRIQLSDRPMGLRIGAFQSLMFGTTGMNLFDEDSWPAFFELLSRQFHIASCLGFRPLVFGSPSQRHIPDSLANDVARLRALEFFRIVGQLAVEESCILLLEPSPRIYGGNFLLTHQETDDFVEEVASPGIGLHWDTGALLAEESLDWTFIKRLSNPSHVHLSLPFLSGDYERHVAFFRIFLNELDRRSYSGLISIEMKGGSMGLVDVERVIDFFARLLRGE